MCTSNKNTAFLEGVYCYLYVQYGSILQYNITFNLTTVYYTVKQPNYVLYNSKYWLKYSI